MRGYLREITLIFRSFFFGAALFVKQKSFGGHFETWDNFFFENIYKKEDSILKYLNSLRFLKKKLASIESSPKMAGLHNQNQNVKIQAGFENIISAELDAFIRCELFFSPFSIDLQPLMSHTSRLSDD